MIDVLLWDFGDTLVDERWMLQAPAEFGDWPAVWTEVMRTRAHVWNIGQLTERELFSELAARSGMAIRSIEQHAAACCGSIQFHPSAWSAALERRRPQAIVTVNPDLFVERVARPYGLDAHFDTIVVSCLEGTDDKTELCEVALDRLGFTGPRSNALLIDNRQDLTDAWARTGGASYHFRGDSMFSADWPGILG